MFFEWRWWLNERTSTCLSSFGEDFCATALQISKADVDSDAGEQSKILIPLLIAGSYINVNLSIGKKNSPRISLFIGKNCVTGIQMMPRQGGCKKSTTKRLRFMRLAIYLNQSEVELREMTCLVDMQSKRAIVFIELQHTKSLPSRKRKVNSIDKQLKKGKHWALKEVEIIRNCVPSALFYISLRCRAGEQTKSACKRNNLM